MIPRTGPALVCFFVLSVWFAAKPTLAAPRAPVPAPTDTLTTRIGDLQVVPVVLPWGDGTISRGYLQSRNGDNLAEALACLPGLTAVRRSADAAEPVIRGLGWERVQTLLGAVPLYGACPGRMDPPATYLAPTSFSRVNLSRGGAMGLMPGATGGFILIDPQYVRAAGTPDGWTTFFDAGDGSARGLFYSDFGVFGGQGPYDIRASVGMREALDYTSPDSILVPADATAKHGELSLARRLSENSRLWGALTMVHEENVDFPAMPMDNIDTDLIVENAGFSWDRPGAGWSALSLTAGASAVDHRMDNSMKPTVMMMPAETIAKTRTWGGHIQAVRTGAARLTLGLDATGLTRDAVRERTKSGQISYDHLWPRARQNTVGGSAELVLHPDGSTRWTVAGRFDVVDSRARAADDTSLQGLTIREQWDRYFDLGTVDPDRTEAVGSGSLRMGRRLSDRLDGFARAGFSTRAAGITERYYAFAPAPGGYQLGNPTLPAEKKREGEAGLVWRGGGLSVQAGVFASWFDDYILPRIVDHIDVDGDDSPDAIRGFVPVDARLYGGELAVEWRPAEGLRIPVSAAYVRGENTTDGSDLPEIPPLKGSAEVLLRAAATAATDTTTAAAAWISARCDFATDQNRIDPQFGENATAGYGVWSVGLIMSGIGGMEVDLRVENLFDREYHDHLTREAALTDGNLLKGQEIPYPGRNFRISARWEF